MFNLLEMMEMLNGMNGEHGGSVCVGLVMEWLEKGCRKKTQFWDSSVVPFDRTFCLIDRTGFLTQLTETVHYPIDRELCPIDQTKNMSKLMSFWHCPIDWRVKF